LLASSLTIHFFQTMSFYPKLETPSYDYKYLSKPYTAGIVGCPFRLVLVSLL